MTGRNCVAFLLLTSIAAGCGSSLVAPTPATSMPPSAPNPPAPPEAPPDGSVATVVIQDFSVFGWYDHGQQRFHYWPKLTLAETAGVSAASISTISFELLDVGPAGRVPPASGSFLVPAGGVLRLDEDLYGPWLEIDSTANAARVSVLLSFVDNAGKGGSVSAIVAVSR